MRTLIGLAILLVVILGLVWYVQRDSSFMSNLFNRSDSGESTEEGTGQDQQNAEESPDSAGTTPETMLTCTAELFVMEFGDEKVRTQGYTVGACGGN